MTMKVGCLSPRPPLRYNLTPPGPLSLTGEGVTRCAVFGTDDRPSPVPSPCRGRGARQGTVVMQGWRAARLARPLTANTSTKGRPGGAALDAGDGSTRDAAAHSALEW